MEQVNKGRASWLASFSSLPAGGFGRWCRSVKCDALPSISMEMPLLRAGLAVFSRRYLSDCLCTLHLCKHCV